MSQVHRQQRLQRAAIAMTAAEADHFLQGRRTMSLATIGLDGRPHVVAMWYGFVRGSLGFLTYQGSQKHRNLLRDPRATCLVEDGEVYEELRGTQLAGRAEVIDDEEGRLELLTNVAERYQGALDLRGRQWLLDRLPRRIAVRLEIEHVVSWDHRKLAHGLGVHDR